MTQTGVVHQCSSHQGRLWGWEPPQEQWAWLGEAVGASVASTVEAVVAAPTMLPGVAAAAVTDVPQSTVVLAVSCGVVG